MLIDNPVYPSFFGNVSHTPNYGVIQYKIVDIFGIRKICVIPTKVVIQFKFQSYRWMANKCAKKVTMAPTP